MVFHAQKDGAASPRGTHNGDFIPRNHHIRAKEPAARRDGNQDQQEITWDASSVPLIWLTALEWARKSARSRSFLCLSVWKWRKFPSIMENAHFPRATNDTPRAFPPSKPVVVEPRWKERFQTVARRATKETNERSRAKQGKKYKKKKETRKGKKWKNKRRRRRTFLRASVT